MQGIEQEYNINYNERSYYAASDRDFETVQHKSEVWRYFKRNTNNECRCNICGAVYQQSGQNTSNMFKHLNNNHAQEVFGFFRVKKAQQGIFTDFLEDIIAAGFPAENFLEALLRLFNCYENQFTKLAEEVGSTMEDARGKIKDVLQKMDLFTDKQQARRELSIQFPQLSQGARKTLLEQNFWMFLQDQEIISRFQRQGYDIITQCQMEDIYSNMVLVTENMRQSYFKSGDSLTINYIDKIFKKRSPRGFDQFSCWYFTGLNQYLEVVFFGFSIISQATVQSYKFVFENFFKKMYGIRPKSICTPQLPKLQATLQSICPEATIVTNWFHKLKYLKQILEPELEGDSILKDMCEAMQTCCQQEYEDILSKIRSKIADQQILKQGIQQENYKHCIPFIQKNFINFSIQARMYLAVEKVVRNQFIYQENLARLFIFVLQLDLKLNKRIISGQKNNLSGNQLNKQLNLSTALKIRWSCSLSQQREIVFQEDKQDQLTFIVFDKLSEKKKSKIYRVKYLVQFNHWSCNCKYLEQTGLPCEHLAIIVDKHGGSIQYYINTRWKIQNIPQQTDSGDLANTIEQIKALCKKN